MTGEVPSVPIFKPADVRDWTGGHWSALPHGDLTGVSHDSRTLQPGQLYIALEGDRFDGHDFVEEAFDRGAAGAMVKRGRMDSRLRQRPCLEVDDTLKSLQQMAASYRTSLPVKLIAVTGSVGKTTVKELLASIVSSRFSVFRTPGNWNNQIGLPLSLLSIDATHDIAVIEVAMNRPGEIALLSGLARPDWGVITPIGAVHMEAFDSVEGVVEEKGSMLKSLSPEGGWFVKREAPYFETLCRMTELKPVTFSLQRDADFKACYESESPARIRVQERNEPGGSFELPQPGVHQAENVLQAVAVARTVGLSYEAIRAGLQTYAALPMRWEKSYMDGITVINDAYNANPLSMRASLQAFAEQPVDGARWAVLGGMHELGEGEEKEHEMLGRFIAHIPGLQGLILVGKRAALMLRGIEKEKGCAHVECCREHGEAAQILARQCRRGDVVLLKASRGEALETVLTCWERIRRIA